MCVCVRACFVFFVSLFFGVLVFWCLGVLKLLGCWGFRGFCGVLGVFGGLAESSEFLGRPLEVV